MPKFGGMFPAPMLDTQAIQFTQNFRDHPIQRRFHGKLKLQPGSKDSL
jgi:hypothetical protein